MNEIDDFPPELESLFRTVEESVSQKDFKEAFDAIREVFAEIQTENADNLSLIQAAIRRLQTVIQQEIDANKDFRALAGTLTSKVDQKLKQVDARLSQIKSGAQGAKGEKGEKGERGERGQRGAPDTPEELREKLVLAKLPITAIEGIEELKEEFNSKLPKTGWGAHPLRLHDDGTVVDKNTRVINFEGATVTRDPDGVVNVAFTGAPTPATPTGTVNGVNTAFTVTGQPSYVIADGITYFENFGYTYAALNITFDVPPSQYVRYFI